MKKREGVKRVLITSIGGGNIEKDGVKYLKKYEKTVYEINGKESEVTTYMPKVVEKEFDVDKTIIIGSTGTMWDNVYKEYCKKNDEKIDRNYVRDLRETERTSDRDTDIKELNISKLNEELVNKVRGIVIKYGLNREEIFENFDSIIKLEEEFNDEDEYEVILDITHSFRSTAFWMFLVMTYLTD
ncbi:MAG: TIGR02221 family CRISPR-associated protein, partial [Fusobacterium nucleatum]|nr:TIGR02221 family CRISPR-associated protein [Fusobacterium nucleatum]